MFVRQIVDPAGDRQVRVHFIFRCDVHEAVIFVEVWTAEVSRTRLLFKQQFAGAAGRFDDRFDKRNAEFPFFEFEDAVDGAARGGSNGVF